MGTTIPIVDYLELGDRPRLIAHACSGCGATYFDRRNACARCGGTEFSDKPLGREGTVRAFTIVQRAAPGVKVPYVSAVVDLDGGGAVKANLVDVEPHPEQIKLGMPVRLVTFPVGSDDQGTEAVAFGFAPA
jgi:uncharacterized OB-fold protein